MGTWAGAGAGAWTTAGAGASSYEGVNVAAGAVADGVGALVGGLASSKGDPNPESVMAGEQKIDNQDVHGSRQGGESTHYQRCLAPTHAPSPIPRKTAQ